MVCILDRFGLAQNCTQDFSGFILTMSPTAGVNFPDIILPEEVQVPPTAGAKSESLNVPECQKNTYAKTRADA